MPWFYVEDNFAFHPKAVDAGNAAIGLWTRAGAWSQSTLTEGFVPTGIARQLGTTGEAKKLTTTGLWVAKDNGYEFHQWDQRQQTRVQIEASREKARERQRRLRERAAQMRDNEGGN